MGSNKSKAYIEQSTCFDANTHMPEISYNIFADEERLTDLSYSRLVAIHDLIAKIIVKRQKGGKIWEREAVK